MVIENIPGGFRLTVGGVELLRHSISQPCLQLARADFHFRSRSGQHQIKRGISRWAALPGYELGDGCIRFFGEGIEIRVEVGVEEGGFWLMFDLPDSWNYARLRLPAGSADAVYGGGMQFSYLNLRGKVIPIFTCEAGVGRDKRRLATILADLVAGAGGSLWSTYNPQAVFLTTGGAGYALEGEQYAQLDFRGREEHVLEFLGPARLRAFSAPGLGGLVSQLTRRSGIMPAPPDWVFEGGILGIQGGLPFVRETLDKMCEAGAVLTGVWTQDWQGIRMTPTGKRLFWNWEVDESLYPNLQAEIKQQAARGIRWLGYLNPYFNAEGSQFKTAREKGYLVKNRGGGDTMRLISEFTIGMLDLTNPEAREWYKDIIRKNLIDLGLRGWMADYGEDVTEDLVFASGQSGTQLHNAYPRLWAQLNREAVEAAGLAEELLVFHRSGAYGQNRWYNQQWGGDQLVGWDEHDGFPSAVAGGLSACLSGIQYYHSDAGGYTTLGWYKRSKELLARWTEANIFSAVLRTHEGNRPWANAQPWTDSETIRHFARCTRLRAALAPYLKHVSAEAQVSGIGMQRPLCLKAPGPRTRDKKDAWYLGDDLLVFPVLRPGLTRLRVEIPEGEWAHLWSGRLHGPGTHVLECQPGKPPVFYRLGTPFSGLFEEMREIQ